MSAPLQPPRNRMGSAICLLTLIHCAPVPAVSDAPDGASVSADSEAGAVVQDGGPSAFATRVLSFEPGPGAGFGQSSMPAIVLGPPQGRGEFMGSTDVVSLGRGGKICLGFDRDIVDGPGPDFIVFENAFRVLGTTDTFVELGEVSVSRDGVQFETFACNTAPASQYTGCAGAHPVLSNSSNGIDPRDPRSAGGDAFDLAALGLSSARVVCIRDLETQPPASPNAGFDLDAISVIHQ